MHVNITSAGKMLFNLFVFSLNQLILFEKAGIIALLEETDERLITYSLKQLNTLVDMFWAEISDSITVM
jgi:hypothetical protein